MDNIEPHQGALEEMQENIYKKARLPHKPGSEFADEFKEGIEKGDFLLYIGMAANRRAYKGRDQATIRIPLRATKHRARAW